MPIPEAGEYGYKKERKFMESDKLLLLFVRNPELGKVKTRIAKELGDEKALEIYKKLLHHTRTITKEVDADRLVYYHEKIGEDDLWDEPVYAKKVQPEGDLGYKMMYAFSNAFKESYQRVIIIGSDCLELNQEIIEQAFAALEHKDVVIGPAKDGGYYLLGMKALYKTLFENKAWSTSSVFQATLHNIRQEGLTYALLPELSDVDKAADVDPALLLL